MMELELCSDLSSLTNCPLEEVHDCFALGEIEIGLPLSSTLTWGESGDETLLENRAEEEVHRLPLIVRLLESARPFSSIPFLKNSQSIQYDVDSDEDDTSGRDVFVSEIVQRLEDRAAAYSAAESVHVVSCHLAPAVTKYVSRVPPLRKIKTSLPKSKSSFVSERGKLDTLYETSLLEEALAATTTETILKRGTNGTVPSKGKKRRRSPESDVQAYNSVDPKNEDLEGSGDEMKLTTGSARTSNRPSSKRKGNQALIEKICASEDSQEFAVIKTFQELVRVTLLSMKQSPNSSPTGVEDDGEGVTSGTHSTKETLTLSMQDSILAETVRSNNTRRQTASCDLAATVASLMHFSPCLRHRDVASALCRAGFTDTPDLVMRLGANCASATSALVNGCVDVYRYAVAHTSVYEQRKHNHHTIAAICKKSVRNIASLSKRESSRVQSFLRRQGAIMMDLQLELALQSDSLAAVCLLISHMARTMNNKTFEPHPIENSQADTKKLHQHGMRRRRTSYSSIDVKPKNIVRSLQDHLLENSELFVRTLEFLVKDLCHCSGVNGDSASIIQWGRVCLSLKAYTWVLLKVGLIHVLDDTKYAQVIDLVCVSAKTMLNIFHRLRVQVSQRSMSNSDFVAADHPYSCLLASIFLIFLVLFPICNRGRVEQETSINPNRVEIWNAFSEFLCTPLASRKSSALSLLALDAVKNSNMESFSKIIEAALLKDDDMEISIRLQVTMNNAVKPRLSLATTWMLKLGAGVNHHENELALFGPSLFFNVFVWKTDSDENLCSRAEIILKKFFNIDDKWLMQLLRLPHTVHFLTHLVYCSHQERTACSLPLVFPIDIEKMSLTANLNGKSIMTSTEVQFFIQLFYSFLYSEMVSTSPFKFDPRVLPLAQVYSLCESQGVHEVFSDSFIQNLKIFIDRHCPEVKLRCYRHLISNQSVWILDDCNDIIKVKCQQKKMLTNVLRKSITQPATDPSGLMAEKSFLLASSILSDSDLISLTTSALLSVPFSPPSFYTYGMLYRDPLTLLKCPISVWNRAGLRRIALTLLNLLLDTNGHFVTECSLHQNIENEFLYSRNEIVLKCLIKFVANPSETGEMLPPCPLACGLVRRIISSTQGIGAMLLKSILSEREVDWIVELIPEMVDESPSLLDVMSDCATFSVAERLILADCIVRLIVIHGHHEHSSITSLMHLALTELINNFFIIIGPVGLSSSSVSGVGDGIGMDSATMARKYAIRILKILQKLRIYRTSLRNECIYGLQKFAGLCRGEILVGTLPAATTNRQKVLLKELLDVTNKASDSMGFIV